ncbi:unnamed protein product [Arctogadus glacialis]
MYVDTEQRSVVDSASYFDGRFGCQQGGLNLRLEMGAVEIPGSGCLAPWGEILLELENTLQKKSEMGRGWR